MDKELRLGQLVHSRAGRDQDKAFIVVGMSGGSFAYIVDGEMRKVDNPKKKNIKHLQLTGLIAETIAEKLAKGDPVNNSEIRKALAGLVSAKADATGQGG